MSINNRTFRVFVSSTFSDLKAERNALQEHVFPKLQKLCKEHGCTFQAIDLRWGVNNEATLDHKTMDICLKEIARCQETRVKPNFIVLLGNRYGWRPLPARINNSEFSELKQFVSRENLELLEEWYQLDNNALYDLEGRKEVGVWTLKTRAGKFEDWDVWEAEEKKLHSILLAAVNQTSFSAEQKMKFTSSATEQEIVNGALNVENAAEHVFCYFRDIAGLPVDESSKDFVDLINDNGTWRTDAEAQQHLEKLKNDSLRNRLGSNIRDYPAGWTGKSATTDHIDQLCADVLEDLTKVIESEIDQMQEDDPLEREVAVHQEFGVDRAKFFTGRIAELDEIQAYLENNEKNPLLIHGESGTGKSALLAKAVEIYQGNYPASVLVQRFIGASAGSSSGGTLLQDLCKEICRKYDVDESDVASDYWDLTKEFHRRLTYAKADKPLVVFIDALDQLSEINDQADLSWLTPGLPDNVKIIISSIPGSWLESAQNRLTFGRPFELKEMNSGEADQLLDYWLHDADRTLTAGQKREVLAKFAENGLPLYLKLAFEEAKLWNSYTPHSETELNPETEGIIRGLFKRFSKNSNHGSLMVSRSLGYLAASRYGLSEEEIVEILSRDQELFDDFVSGIHHRLPEQKLPIVVWSRLYHDLEEYLTAREVDGIPLINFYHRQLREVVEADYLNGADREYHHLHLADYFETLEICKRQIAELPWQLQEGKAWQRLYDLLADLDFFDAAWKKNKYGVKGYWVKVETNSNFKKVDAYKKIINNPANYMRNAWFIGELLTNEENIYSAYTLWDKLSRYYRIEEDWAKLQVSVGYEAIILHSQGNYEQALKKGIIQEELCVKNNDIIALVNCRANQGSSLFHLGDYSEALLRFQNLEELSIKEDLKDGLALSRGNMGIVYEATGKYEKSLMYHAMESQIWLELFDFDGMQRSLCCQGIVLRKLKRFEQAKQKFITQENICVKYGLTSGLLKSWLEQGQVFHDQGDRSNALSLYSKVEKYTGRVSDVNIVQTCLGRLANLHSEISSFEMAKDYYAKQEAICQDIKNWEDLIICLFNQGLMYEDLGENHKALLMYERQEKLCQEIGLEERLLASLNRQGQIFASGGMAKKALDKFEKAENVSTLLEDDESLICSLTNQASMLGFGLNRQSEALEKIELARQLAVDKEDRNILEKLEPIYISLKRISI